MTSISTWTKRGSLAQRSISATDFSTLCTGITIEPRSRGSLSSHSLTSQSFSARQNASAMSSENTICTPYSGLQMPVLTPKRSSACVFMSSRLEPGLPCAGRQSGRDEIGELVG